MLIGETNNYGFNIILVEVKGNERYYQNSNSYEN